MAASPPIAGPAKFDRSRNAFAANMTTAITTLQRANPRKSHSGRGSLRRIEDFFGPGNEPADPAHRVGHPPGISRRKV